jgi:MFS family permease
VIHSTKAPYRWRWLAFAAVLAASVMDLMDSTIAGVAAPTIRHDLGGSNADLQWVTAAYGLAMAVVLLIGGRLGDVFAILGPIVAGLLIGADVLGTGWRMISLVNLPVGAGALLVGARFLPAVPPPVRSARLDAAGIALAAAGAFSLVYPLVQGRELGWPAWAMLMLAGSVAVFAAFGVHQVARRRRGLTPLVEPSVFARRAYTSGLGFAVVFCAAMGGATLSLTVLLQVGLGYTPLGASLSTATWGVGAFAGSAVGERARRQGEAVAAEAERLAA